MNLILTSLIFISCTLFYSCNSSEKSSNIKDISFEVIREVNYGGYEESKVWVIQNNEDYQTVMNKVYENLDQRPVVPDVDFTKSTLIAVFMGAKKSDGYSIQVENINSDNKTMTVNVKETSSGKNCKVGSVMTHPFQIIKINKFNELIKFNTVKETKDCN